MQKYYKNLRYHRLFDGHSNETMSCIFGRVNKGGGRRLTFPDAPPKRKFFFFLFFRLLRNPLRYTRLSAHIWSTFSCFSLVLAIRPLHLIDQTKFANSTPAYLAKPTLPRISKSPATSSFAFLFIDQILLYVHIGSVMHVYKINLSYRSIFLH